MYKNKYNHRNIFTNDEKRIKVKIIDGEKSLIDIYFERP